MGRSRVVKQRASRLALLPPSLQCFLPLNSKAWLGSKGIILEANKTDLEIAAVLMYNKYFLVKHDYSTKDQQINTIFRASTML